MKNRTLFARLSLFVFALPVMLMFLGGCKDLGQQITIANDTTATVLRGLDTARATGVLKQKDIDEAKPFVDAVVASCRAATAAYLRGDRDAARVYLQSFDAASNELLRWRARVLKRE